MNSLQEYSSFNRNIYFPSDDRPIISFELPQKLPDSDISSGADMVHQHLIDSQLFHIRMVNTARRREAASLLVKEKYSWRGYSVFPPSVKEPNQIALMAETEGKIVGTITLCVDGRVGLPADEDFRDRIDELRAQGCRLSEPSRLAIDNKLPQRIFASLLHIAYIYAYKIFGLTDWVAEVNPRHMMFYKKMLGFELVGEERSCTRVSAPAVLLNLQLEYMEKQIEKFGGTMEKHGRERSLYPYFFSKKDESGITSKLKTCENNQRLLLFPIRGTG